VPGGGEPGHVRAGLGDDHVGQGGADPGYGHDEVAGATKGLDHHLDPGGELVHGVGVLIDQGQVQPGQERVMGGEPAGQRLGERGDLDPEPGLRQVGEHRGITLTVDQRVEHRPPGRAADVGGHRGQCDPGVFQQLLQALPLPGPFPGDRGPRAGQVPQLADRLRWHERAADQSVRAQLRQPGRVRDIGFAARDVLDLPGVDQHHLKRGVLQQVVERLPIVPGRL